jgi:hypothetical protein
VRLLFYTATFALLSLGAAFAYFAVQAPQPDTGAKVVISIEPFAASVAEARTEEILRNAKASGDLQRPEYNSDRSSPQVEGADVPEGTAADAGSYGLSQQDAASQNVAELEEEETPESSSDTYVLPGAIIADLNEEPGQQERFKRAPGQAVARNTANNSDGAGNSELSETEPKAVIVETGTQPEVLEPITETGPQEQQATVDQQRIAAIAVPETESASGGNPVVLENKPEETQIIPAQPVVEQPETAEVEPEGTHEVSTNEQPELTGEDPQKLRATFNAFVASLKEKERTAETTSLIPPLPLRRPDNIPAPVRTASLDGGGNTPTRIAILLRGVGRNEKNSDFAVNSLPSAITLAFAPYVGRAQQWALQARELGHEIIIQIPLEPADYPNTNPGPETLLTSSGASENVSKMRTVLGRFNGYSGITNYFGGKLLKSQEAVRPMLEDIKSRGLMYISEPDENQALVKKLAAEIGVIYGGADIVIDTYQTPDSIQKGLDELVALARKQGSAIGMAYASRTSIEQIRIWSEAVSSKGITLVPVGVLAQTLGAS